MNSIILSCRFLNTFSSPDNDVLCCKVNAKGSTAGFCYVAVACGLLGYGSIDVDLLKNINLSNISKYGDVQSNSVITS
jgi:hypothetical protein